MNEETQDEQTEGVQPSEEVPTYEPLRAELMARPAGTLPEFDALPDDHPDSPYFSQKDIDPSQRVWPPA
jgi:hypothetical protein